MTSAAKPYTAGISQLRRPVLDVVGDDLRDDQLSIDQLGSRIVGMSGRLASAMCRWLLLIADFDARAGAAKFCLGSTGRWLSHYCGLSGRTAREHVRVARVLAAHDRLAASFGAGRISYSHVRAIARVADLGNEQLVADLVMLAEHGTVGQLEDTVRGLRTVDRNNRPHEPARETLTHRWREDSHLGLSAKLDPEHGALVLAAVGTLARREGITHAEALTRMAEITLATINSSGSPAPSLRSDEYAAVVIHLDADRLPAEDAPDSPAGPEGGSAEPLPEVPAARIAGGPGLPDATVKRLLCSGRIRALVTRDHPDAEGDLQSGAPEGGRPPTGRYRWRAGVLDVGANRRLVSAKQFRALVVRDDGCCTVPGCGSTFGLEAHHVQHWAYGGKTVMANLLLLCRAHHHAVHDDEFTIIALGQERFRFHRPDRRELPQQSAPPRLTASDRAIENDHDHVTLSAATTRWDGAHLDLDYAVAGFAQGLTSTAKRTA